MVPKVRTKTYMQILEEEKNQSKIEEIPSGGTEDLSLKVSA